MLLIGLREHEDPHLGVLAAQLERGAQPVVPVVRWHLHVHEGDVGTVREALAQEIVGVPGLGHDVESRLRQQPRYALPQQHVVLSNQKAQPFFRHNRRNGTR